MTYFPISCCFCVSGPRAGATQRCPGGSDCGRRRSGSPWPASWLFYHWCTGSPPGPSWFCGGCSIGRLCRSRSNGVCRPGCSCSSCRRSARQCRSAPPAGTCCLSAAEERMKRFLFNEENSYTVNEGDVSKQKEPLVWAQRVVSTLAGSRRVWSYIIGSASPSHTDGSCWWPWWTRPGHTFGNRRPTLWSARCSSGWSPNRQIWPFPPGDRLKWTCTPTSAQSSRLSQ